MEKYSTKKHQSNKCSDRLSELPDDILVHILSFMRTKDAVRTVLLRRFGNLWTLLPTIEFDDYFGTNFMNNVLKYHKNPTIDKFSLLCDYPQAKKGYLKKWTNFALSRKTKELSVIIEVGPSIYFVPPRVFRNQCLVKLDLYGLEIKLPHRVFMGSLRRLVLASATICDKTFQNLISGCPCLQELIVDLPYDLEQLHFTAPSIERLELEFSLESDANYPHYSLDCPNLKILYIESVFIENLKVIDVSSVREAYIWCSTQSIDDQAKIDDEYFELLLKIFQNAEVFRLNNKDCVRLQPCGSIKRDFWRLMPVDLAVRSGVHRGCVLGFCKLLRAVWHWRLVNLVIYADVEFSCDCNMLLSELSHPCVMRKLKTITIRDCVKPCQGLLQMIKLLLKGAVILDKLVIICNKDQLFSLEGRPFILELLSFPRASQQAKVVIA